MERRCQRSGSIGQMGGPRFGEASGGVREYHASGARASNSGSAQQSAGRAWAGTLGRRSPLSVGEPRTLRRVRKATRIGFDSVRHTFCRSASPNTCPTAATLSSVANFAHRTVRKGPCLPLSRNRSWCAWPAHESRDLACQKQTPHLAGRPDGESRRDCGSRQTFDACRSRRPPSSQRAHPWSGGRCGPACYRSSSQPAADPPF